MRIFLSSHPWKFHAVMADGFGQGMLFAQSMGRVLRLRPNCRFDAADTDHHPPISVYVERTMENR
jgi:hypothetical protein